MRNYFLSICLIASHLGHAQIRDTTFATSTKALYNDDYMQKYKANKSTAHIMLFSGVGLALGGILVNMGTGWGPGNTNNGLWLSYLGGGSIVTSIPFYIGAAKNKRKAQMAVKEIAFGKISLNKSSHISMVLKINF
jgi:hypothetical protein